MVNAKIF